TVPALMLVAVAVQMIAGRHEPVFPHFIIARRLPTRHLLRLGERAVPLLRYLERAVHPRWPTTFETAKHFVGVMVLLLAIASLPPPAALNNIPPAMVTALMSLPYIEEAGLLLCFAFLAAIILLGLASATVWGTVVGAVLISR